MVDTIQFPGDFAVMLLYGKTLRDRKTGLPIGLFRGFGLAVGIIVIWVAVCFGILYLVG